MRTRGFANRGQIKITFKLCNTSSALFWALLNEFFHAISMVMATFWNLHIPKHLFQFLNVSELASIGSTYVASMTCKKNRENE